MGVLVNKMPDYINNKLKRLICPKCGNDKIYIKIDFKNGKNKKGEGVCIKRIYKSSITKTFLKPKIVGCGKKFKLIFRNR